MQCQVCNTPYMIAPSVGSYCPDLECNSHVWQDERDLEVIVQFEVRRRQRGGGPVTQFLRSTRRRVRQPKLQKFNAALTSQPVTPGPTMAAARTVAPFTPATTSGAMICTPPPISAKALKPSTPRSVSGSQVPFV